MNKKKKIIIFISTIFVLSGLGYWLYIMFKPEDLAKYVPKNSLFVMKIDLFSLGKKMNLNEISKSDLYKNLSSLERADDKKVTNFIKEIVKNPKSSGINFLQSPYFFTSSTNLISESPDESETRSLKTVNKESKKSEKLYHCLVFGVSDRKKLVENIKNLFGYKSQKQGEFTWIYDYDDDKNVMYINDKVAFLMFKSSYLNNDKFKEIAENLLNQKKEESILTSENFNKLVKEKKDVTLAVNKSALSTLLQKENFLNDNYMPNLFLRGMSKAGISGMTVNFEDGAIRQKCYFDNRGKDLIKKVSKSIGMSDSNLKLFSPNGQPLMYFTANIDVKNILELLSQKKYIENIFSFESEKPLNYFSSLISGNISVALNSFKLNTNEDILYGDSSISNSRDSSSLTQNVKTPNLDLVIHTTLENPSQFDEIINNEIYVQKNPVIKFLGNGIFALDFSAIIHDLIDPVIYFSKKDKELLISTNLENIQSFINGSPWKALSAEPGKSYASSKPYSFFLDFNSINIKDILSNYNLPTEVDLSEVNSLIKSNFKYISAFLDADGFQVELKMSDQKENSLFLLFKVIDKACKFFIS